MMQPFIVELPESGQKLLQFLCRRLNTPKTVIHRWIRTGQIRVNGKRVQPFIHITTKDVVRIPPFATNDLKKHSFLKHPHNIKKEIPTCFTLPKIIAETQELLVLSKPAGLPTHGGYGHLDNVAYRLLLHYKNHPFKPTPIHRLDKDTSGLLLIAKNYITLKRLSLSFSQHSIQKEYLAWVTGSCPWNEPTYLEDMLIPIKLNKKKHIVCYPPYDASTTQIKPQKASLTACCIKQSKNYSLLHIKLHTGRTHQIRVQLSKQNFPLVGDKKYGDIYQKESIKLHAFRITINNYTYEDMPSWIEPWIVKLTDIPTDNF